MVMQHLQQGYLMKNSIACRKPFTFVSFSM
jgi:hypothetical protein